MMRSLLVGTSMITLSVALGLVACDDEETSPGPTGGSTTSSTTPTGTATGSGGSGGTGICENDDHEPNDAPTAATELADLTDENVEPTPELSGVIDGTDTDWYVYAGEDVYGLTVVDPEQSFESPATILRLCAYFWCSSTEAWGAPAIGSEGGSGAGGSGAGGGPPTHICPEGTEEVTEDLSAYQHDGQALGLATGCCTTAGTSGFHLGGYYPTVHWPLDCPGTLDSDSMLVFLRVEKYATQPAELCQPYTVLYHF